MFGVEWHSESAERRCKAWRRAEWTLLGQSDDAKSVRKLTWQIHTTQRGNIQVGREEASSDITYLKTSAKRAINDRAMVDEE